MTALVDLYLAHPAWAWAAAAAAFLAIEVATGTTYLLWPAGSAAVVALLSFALPPPRGLDAAIFAALTIVSTLVGRRYIHRGHAGNDINDPHHRLIGRRGAVAAGFRHGEGRVLVDGKEWAAETDVVGELVKDQPVEVAAVLDGGRLKVRPL